MNANQAIVLAGILGLDPNSAADSKLIAHNIQGIEDLGLFIEFCEDRISHPSLSFKKPSQMLVIQAKAYKKIQEEAKLPHDTAETFSRRVAEKVATARIKLKNYIAEGVERPFSRLIVDGKKHFDNIEIKALVGVSKNPSCLIELSEAEVLEEKLIELFMKRHIGKTKYNALTDGQKKIKALIAQGA